MEALPLTAISWTETSTNQDGPIFVLFDHGVDLLRSLIEKGTMATTTEYAIRDSVQSMLNHLTVVCRDLYARFSAHPMLPALMFYERTRLGCLESGYFLEGCPIGLPLFVGSCAVTIPDGDLTNLELSDAVSDRLVTIQTLERLSQKTNKREKMSREHQVHDLPPKTPLVVRVLVSRTRAICQGLRRVKETGFAQCQNRCCNRLFFCGERNQNVTMRLHRITNSFLSPGEWDSEDDCYEDDGYWTKCRGKTAHRKRYNKRFCSTGCRRQWHAQLRMCLPISDVPLDADERCRKTSRARVLEAFRKVMHRNEEAYRAMRSISKRGGRVPAVANEHLHFYRQRRIRMLNIDAGMLYAASVIAESSQLSTGRLLPGAKPGWRNSPLYYQRLLPRMHHEYDKSRVQTVISNPLVMNKFFSRLKKAAVGLF